MTPQVLPCTASARKPDSSQKNISAFSFFWGAYLVATQTPGQSALQFQRPLGLSRYGTAFQMLHKLRAGMVRPERDAIGSQHPVEVDETLVGDRGQRCVSGT